MSIIRPDTFFTGTYDNFPDVYGGVLEIEELVKTSDITLSEALNRLDAVWLDNFLMTASETGVRRYERILGIVPNAAVEDLEFRRQRVFNRLQMSPPYTTIFLRRRLDNILGANNYTLDIDYNNYLLIIGMTPPTKSWNMELTITVTNLKPANMVFVTRLFMSDIVLISEQINLRERVNNYKLGVSWFLNPNLPFVSFVDKGAVKLPEIHSIQNPFLNIMANKAVDEVYAVRLNGTYLITTFDSKTVTENKAIFEYTIPASAGLGQVTLIEVLSTGNQILTSSPVYIDTMYDSYLKQQILFKVV